MGITGSNLRLLLDRCVLRIAITWTEPGLKVEWASWAIYRLRRGRGKASADLFWQDGYRCVCGEKPVM